MEARAPWRACRKAILFGLPIERTELRVLSVRTEQVAMTSSAPQKMSTTAEAADTCCRGESCA